MKTRWDVVADGSVPIPVNEHFGFRREEVPDHTEEVVFTWKVPPELCNSAGNLQGGMVAAFADSVLGAACSAHVPADHYPALAEMKVSFFRPAPAGTKVTGKGRVLKAGKRLLFVEAEIFDGQGRLVAKVSGTEVPAPAP